ncbi:pectin lyase fold/virulence factor [Amylocystis lapponica]|nr:pectin lyase fold/virulence factor [Amylocystis lapponica]
MMFSATLYLLASLFLWLVNLGTAFSSTLAIVDSSWSSFALQLTCRLRPLGEGADDTDQVEAAIARCGHYGTTIFKKGNYNITRRLWWDLVEARVDLHGYLNFVPDIQYWLNGDNTYRVIFIQNQASWFVISGRDFIVDAHWTGGIQGNGQPWWSYYGNGTGRAGGDGRPVGLTIYRASRATVAHFRIEAQPFWCNAIAESEDFVYDGMYCNATNQDPLYVGQKRISLFNWSITCGDDCLAIKGNSTDIIARNITCYGGNGIAVGSLGQYAELNDDVDRVLFEDLRIIRLPHKIQPNMFYGVYLKTWSGSVNGTPPVGGGGGGGFVSNFVSRNVTGVPSKLQFSNLSFANWKGNAVTNEVVNIVCSPAFPCQDVSFRHFDITLPAGEVPVYVCQNVVHQTGLPCNATGSA